MSDMAEQYYTWHGSAWIAVDLELASSVVLRSDCHACSLKERMDLLQPKVACCRVIICQCCIDRLAQTGQWDTCLDCCALLF